MTLGEKLQLLRRSRGLSQEQLAAELDVSWQAISKWECGDSTPDLDKLRTICTYLGKIGGRAAGSRAEAGWRYARAERYIQRCAAAGDDNCCDGSGVERCADGIRVVYGAALRPWCNGDSRRCAGLYGLEKARQTDLFWHCRSRCGAGDRSPGLYAWLSGGSVVDVERVCGRGRLADRLGERGDMAAARLALLSILSCPDRRWGLARAAAQKEGEGE